jgi:hypothetical protein
MVSVIHLLHIPVAHLTTFGGSVFLYHALDHPMIVFGNKLAAALARKNVPARIEPLAAGAGAGR